MADIGLNQNISLGERQFHIQTATNLEEGLVRTEVFEQGRLLFTESRKYERRNPSRENGADLRLRRMVEQFHRGTISGLETLFELSELIATEDRFVPHQRLGAIFLSLNLYDKAEIELMRAIDLKPEAYSAYIVLAKCYFYQKRYQQAGQTLEPLVKQRIPFPDLYNLMGLIMLEQKSYINALNNFRHALKLNPRYREAYYNLATAVMLRINLLRMQNKKEEAQKNLDFLQVVIGKIEKIGEDSDKVLMNQVKQSLEQKKYGKMQRLVYDHRNSLFHQAVPPEVLGYEFYLWLRYLPERLDYEMLRHFDARISATLQGNKDFPDMWSYLALIHLMLCRDYFLKGLENFKEATKINPRFTKARKNLRLVENDGREFLSLIKAIVKD